jgi:hypothetical protein
VWDLNSLSRHRVSRQTDSDADYILKYSREENLVIGSDYDAIAGRKRWAATFDSFSFSL